MTWLPGQSWFSRLTRKQSSIRRKTHTPRLTLERLEDRLNPANILIDNFSAGQLVQIGAGGTSLLTGSATDVSGNIFQVEREVAVSKITGSSGFFATFNASGGFATFSTDFGVTGLTRIIYDGQPAGESIGLVDNGFSPVLNLTGTNRIVVNAGSDLGSDIMITLFNGANSFQLTRAVPAGGPTLSLIGFDYSSFASVSGTLDIAAITAMEIYIFSTQPGADTTLDFVVALEEVDFGDAPTADQSGFANSYPTTLAQDGARHLATGPQLRPSGGTARDAEDDGQPTANADGDGADENGVTLPAAGLARGASQTITVDVTGGSGKLSGWVDFNRDGDWDDLGEQVLTDATVVDGSNSLSFTVPATALLGTSFARFRLSSAGGLTPVGPAEDGEVEDYRLTIVDSVTVAASPASVAENSGTGIVYTFTRTGSTALPLTANFTVGGSATLSDYTVTSSDPSVVFTATAGSVTFAAGSAVATITLTPVGDSTVEPDEDAVVAVAAGVGYGVGTPAAATGVIANDDTDVSVALVGGSSVSEDGATNLVYRFTRSGVTTGAITANFNVGGTATLASTDYSQTGAATLSDTSGTVTFGTGVTFVDVTINPTADSTVEADETLTFTMATGTGYNPAGAAATGTVTNDDAEVSVAVSTTSVAEDGGTNLVYTFTRTGFTTGALTVNFTVGGAATFTADYAQSGAATFTGTTGTVTFAPDELTATVTITPTADAADEPDEDVTLTLTSGGGYTVVAPTAATGTITDDDAPPAFTIGDVAVNEADGTATFTVTRNGATAFVTSVDYATAGGTATSVAGGPGTPDFSALGTTKLTFAASANATETQTITVPITDDSVYEAAEQFVVNLTNPVNSTVGDAQAVAVITDNDPAPVISIGDVVVGENGMAKFTITLTGATALPISVGWATADDTAVSTSSATPGTPDFTGLAGTVTFTASASGTQTADVSIPITTDATDEIDERFFVNLSGATGGAAIGDAQATGTITDDDAPPTLSVSNASVTEGASGTASLSFTVTLSRASSKTVTVTYATADGSATLADADYQTAGGILTFAPGETSKLVTVLVNGDTAIETSETLSLSLSGATNATITTQTGTGTILNDDFPPDTVRPTVRISAPSVTAVRTGGVVRYTITYSDENFASSSLSPANIRLNRTGTANGTIVVIGTGKTRTVTIRNITGNGTLSISLLAGTAVDKAGNKALAIGPSKAFSVLRLALANQPR